MSTAASDVDRWRQMSTEGAHLEFKAARTQIDGDDLAGYCVAIANEGGGRLLLGVSDKAPRMVVGSNALRAPGKHEQWLFDKLGFRVTIEEVAHPDGRVVVVTIPARPHGTAYHLDGRYLMRAGESLVAMSEDRLREIFAEGRHDWLEEPAVSDLDAQVVVERLDVQGYFELLKLPLPSDRGGVLRRLIADRLVDENDGRFAIRRIGAVLLARRLEDFPDLARKAPRVVIYAGTTKLETRLDQSFTRGFAAGFQALVQFVSSQLPQNEVVEDALRRDVKLVPEIVVRELVANALVHQDLSMGGASVMIEVFADRLEISNPGEPIVPVERFIDGYQSRNERLADLMRRLGICEEKSSGVDKVVHAAELFQLPAPDFRSVHRRTLVTICGPRPFDEMTRADRLRACYQHCALRYVMSEPMTNQSLRERFRLSQSKIASVSQTIAATVEAGLIKIDAASGLSRRYARYLPFWA